MPLALSQNSSHRPELQIRMAVTYHTVQEREKMEFTDLNWVFSAIPQSFASISGIMGAFIISKILSMENEFVTLKMRLDEYINISDYLKINKSFNLSIAPDPQTLQVNHNNSLLIHINIFNSSIKRIKSFFIFNILIFFIGVIVPLLFVPVINNCSFLFNNYSYLKFSLIIAISIIFILFIIKLFHIIKTMKFDENKLKKIEYYSSFKFNEEQF